VRLAAGTSAFPPPVLQPADLGVDPGMRPAVGHSGAPDASVSTAISRTAATDEPRKPGSRPWLTAPRRRAWRADARGRRGRGGPVSVDERVAAQRGLRARRERASGGRVLPGSKACGKGAVELGAGSPVSAGTPARGGGFGPPRGVGPRLPVRARSASVFSHTAPALLAQLVPMARWGAAPRSMVGLPSAACRV
jgi:hypothetical protein